MKKGSLKLKKDCPQANFECLKHAKNFWNTIKFWSLKIFNQWSVILFVYNPIFCAPFVTFQEFKIIVLSIFHTPHDSFYFTS
jgi:hypothetical protein